MSDRSRSGAWCRFRGANLHLADEARAAMTRALRRGELQRGSCVVCGNPRSEGHHENYAEPLEVVWLCRFHHASRHQGETVDEMPAPMVAA